MPRVLLVDDSRTARLALQRVLACDPRIVVVGEARGPADALAALKAQRPDVVLMDVHLAGGDGVAVTAEIMARQPTPVIIVTGVQPDDPSVVFRALAAGALDVEGKPPPARDPSYDRYCRRLTRLVTMLTGAPVITRRATHAAREPGEECPRPTQAPVRLRAIVMGASTGGPPVLQALLAALPAPFPLPIAIVQHITEGFAAGMADWLQQMTGHRTVLCRAPQPLAPGTLYLADSGSHLRLLSPDLIGPVDGPPRGYLRPCVDELFESAAAHLGPAAMAILFTGMGHDGAVGMAAMRRVGAATIAQQPATCTVGSMPEAAIARGATSDVLSPDEMVVLLRRLA